MRPFLRVNMTRNNRGFNIWLDKELDENIPNTISAYCINLNESPFCIEVIGSNEFSKENDDWACYEDWLPTNRNIAVSKELFGNSWEEAQSNIESMVEGYLESDFRNVKKLKSAKTLAIGFVDGILSYFW